METVKIIAERRGGKGKGHARKLRKKGYIPAVVYSGGKGSEMLSVDAKKFKNLYDKGLKKNHILHLTLNGGKESKDTLIKEIQLDPVTDDVIHLDFYEIDINKPLVVEVSVRIINENVCKGITEHDGILIQHTRTLNVYALPSKVPENIEVDVKDVDVGDELLVKDMPALEGIKYVDDPDKRVLSLAAKKIIEITPEGEEESEEKEEKSADKAESSKTTEESGQEGDKK